LDPETLDYQYGWPGRRAIYTIEPLPDGLRFTLDADDADGKPMHFVYGGKPDGQDVPIPNTVLTLALDKPDEKRGLSAGPLDPHHSGGPSKHVDHSTRIQAGWPTVPEQRRLPEDAVGLSRSGKPFGPPVRNLN
jgi:hypothetical protein